MQIVRGELEDEEQKEWCGSWDPEAFDRDACNQQLARLRVGLPELSTSTSS